MKGMRGGRTRGSIWGNTIKTGITTEESYPSSSKGLVLLVINTANAPSSYDNNKLVCAILCCYVVLLFYYSVIICMLLCMLLCVLLRY